MSVNKAKQCLKNIELVEERIKVVVLEYNASNDEGERDNLFEEITTLKGGLEILNNSLRDYIRAL